MATHCSMYNSQGTTGIAILQGPDFLKQMFYNQSPVEDLTLAKMLVRPCNEFIDDSIMKDEKLLNGDDYGSVKNVYVIAMDDNSLPDELQRWMIVLSSPDVEVEEIAGADHFVLCFKPRELCDILVKVANKHDS